MSALAVQLAEWATRVSFNDLPDDVVEATKQRLLDLIGVAFAGRSTEFGAGLSRLAAKLPSDAAPGFHAVGAATFPHLNAFLNGSLSAALDFDDTHNETVIHPTGPTAAAVLALAEGMPLSGKDIILAVAVGSEVCCRIGVGAPGEFHKRGFHPTGIIGAYGAAAGAAKALRLDTTETVSALGLASSLGAGIMQSWMDGTDARYIHNGNAALAGLISAQLASVGVTGPSECLEGKFGIFATHIQGSGPLPFSRVVEKLGADWESRKVSFKPYPSGHVTHSFIDAALELTRENKLKPDDIDSIVCHVAEYMVPIVCEPESEKRAPATHGSARVSMHHIIAEAVVFGEVSALSFSPERLKDPRVRRLAAATSYVIDKTAPPRGQFKGWVQIKLKNGTQLERVKDTNWGSAEHPMTRDDLIRKFVINLRDVVPEPRARDVAEKILSMDASPDLGPIFALLVGNPKVSSMKPQQAH